MAEHVYARIKTEDPVSPESQAKMQQTSSEISLVRSAHPGTIVTVEIGIHHPVTMMCLFRTRWTRSRHWGLQAEREFGLQGGSASPWRWLSAMQSRISMVL